MAAVGKVLGEMNKPSDDKARDYFRLDISSLILHTFSLFICRLYILD